MDRLIAAAAVLALTLAWAAAPVYAQSDLEKLGSGLVRHPVELPPPPPTVYTRYLNLTGEELSCVSLGVAVYLETVALIGRGMLGDDGVARVGDFEIPASSLADLEYLATIFYTASVYLAVRDYDRAETLLQDVAYGEVSRKLEALGDALKLSTVRGNNMSLAAAVVSITPLLTCIDDDPPPGYPIIEPGDIVEAERAIAGGLDPESIGEEELLSNLSMLVTYQVSLVLERKSPDTGYYVYRGVNTGSNQLYPFQLPPCQEEAQNVAWERLACLIPNTFPTRFHMIPSLLLAQRTSGNIWILPLPGEEAAGYYETIDKLERFSSVYETMLSTALQVNLTLTREEPQAQLPDIQDIDPINLEQEIRDILREKRLQDTTTSQASPPPEPQQEVQVTSGLAEIAKTRLTDFKDLLRSVTGVRERINASLQIQAPARPPSLGQVDLGEPTQLGLSLPSISPWILALPLAVFAGYMARDTLAMAGAMARGLLSRGTGLGGPEPVLCYEAALRAVERRGAYKRPSETPREFLERVRPLLDPREARGLEAATRVYEEYKYAGVEPGRRELDECWRSVRRLLRPWGSLRRQ